MCKDLYSTQRTYHITIIIYLTQLNAGPEFRFGNFSLSQVFTLRKKVQCLQGYSPAVFELYRGLWGAHFFLFFITGGFCALAMGLQIYIKAKIHKSRLNFSRFRFFLFSFYGLLFNDQIKLYLSKSMSN